MAWIESHQELARHPKTKKLARALQISLPCAVGHLHFLWWWAMDYAQDGDLSRYDYPDIADACGWEGDANLLVASLVEAGYLEQKGGLLIHDWDDYAGRLLDKRKANTERKRKSRESHASVTRDNQETDATVTGLPNQTVPNHTKPNNTKPKDTPLLSPKGERFTPPSLEEVVAYCEERRNNVDAGKWFDFYASKGWMVGKNKMKDWKAAVRTWEKNSVLPALSQKGVNHAIHTRSDAGIKPEDSITGGQVGWIGRDKRNLPLSGVP